MAEEPLVTTWTDTEGRDHTVTTYRGNGQSEVAWHAQHDAAVGALKQVYPPA